MVRDAFDIHGQAFKNGAVTCLARVVGADGVAIVQADLTAIEYTVYLLDDQDPDSRTPITSHTAVAVAIATSVFDALQTDDLWDADATGYNFRYALSIATAVPFAIAGRNYLVEFTFDPVAGEDMFVRFRCHAI